MEVFPSNRELRAGAASDGKRVRFLDDMEAGGWPLVYSLWETSRARRDESEGGCAAPPARSFYVDNDEAPNCVMERYPIHPESEKEDGSEGVQKPAADIPYIHMTLCVAPNTSPQQEEAIAAMDAFESHGALDWKEKLLFPYLNTFLLEEIRRRAQDQGGEILCEGLSRVYAVDTSTFATSSETCTSTEGLPLQEGTFVGNLDADDAATINKHWKYGGSQRTLSYLTNNIRSSVAGFAVGVFVGKSDDGAVHSRVASTETGHYSRRKGPVTRRRSLVAWGMVSTYGAIGMLQTLPAYQRRGLAQVIIHRLVAALCQESLPAFAVIEVDNPQSQRCFEKAGFRVVPGLDVVWGHYFPPGMTPIQFVNEERSTAQQQVVGTCT